MKAKAKQVIFSWPLDNFCYELNHISRQAKASPEKARQILGSDLSSQQSLLQASTTRYLLGYSATNNNPGHSISSTSLLIPAHSFYLFCIAATTILFINHMSSKQDFSSQSDFTSISNVISLEFVTYIFINITNLPIIYSYFLNKHSDSILQSYVLQKAIIAKITRIHWFNKTKEFPEVK